MSIICATDFSPRSQTAVDAVSSIAARLGEPEVWLVHAIDPNARELDPVAFDRLRSAAVERIEALAQQVRARSQAQVQIAVIDGPVQRTLPAFVQQKGARLLILGPPAPADLPVVQLAGTAEAVIQASPVPVLVVRSALPFQDWRHGHRALKVVVGVDESRASASVFGAAQALAQGGDVDLTAVEVYYADDAGRRYGIPVKSWTEPGPEVERLVARDLARRLGDPTGTAVRIAPTLGFGRMGDHLLEAARAAQADLVVVGTHNKRGLARLGSVSSVVLAFGDVSTLVVPTQGVEAPAAQVQIRSVLVGTDLSPRSDQAVAWACALVRGPGGVVHLVHVDTEVPPAPRDEALARLQALLPREAMSGIQVHLHVLAQEDIAEAIHEAAARLGVDVICVASHGRTGVARMMLGSVAEQVLRTSRRPVLVVRPDQG